MNNWIKDFGNVGSLIKAIMKDHPETRKDDRKLILKVWEHQGLVLTKKQQDQLFKCSPVETITRARRKYYREL